MLKYKIYIFYTIVDWGKNWYYMLILLTFYCHNLEQSTSRVVLLSVKENPTPRHVHHVPHNFSISTKSPLFEMPVYENKTYYCINPLYTSMISLTINQVKGSKRIFSLPLLLCHPTFHPWIDRNIILVSLSHSLSWYFS